MFNHHRFGREFSLNLQRKFLFLLCLWRGLGHKLLHAKFQTCSFLSLAAGAAKVTCPNVLNSWIKICIIGRVALLVMQGGVMSAHAVGRSATAVKALTREYFTLTLDLQRLSSLTCDLSVSCRTFDLHLFLYFPIRTCACNLA